MSTFCDRLPPELVSLILEQLASDATNGSFTCAAALARLSKTCTKLHSMTIPYLYRHVDLGNVGGRRLRARLLLRTIRSRPDLATFMQRIDLAMVPTTYGMIDWDDSRMAEYFTAELSDPRFVFLRSQLGAFEWYGAFLTELACLSIVAINVRCLNIRILDESSGQYGASTFEMHLWEDLVIHAKRRLKSNSATEPLSPFPELREIRTYLDGSLTSFQHVSHSTITAVKRFPKIKSLTLCSDIYGTDEWLNPEASPSSIVSLHLSELKHDPQDRLQSLIPFCPALQELSMRWYSQVHPNEAFQIDFTLVSSVIRRYTPSLQNFVCVKPTNLRIFSDIFESGEIPFGSSLRQFDQMQSLEVDDGAIRMSGDLPSLQGEVWDHRRDAEVITEQFAGFFPPDLKVFILHTRLHITTLPDLVDSILTHAPSRLERLTLTFPLLEGLYKPEQRQRLRRSVGRNGNLSSWIEGDESCGHEVFLFQQEITLASENSRLRNLS